MKIHNKMTTPLSGEVPADNRAGKTAGAPRQEVAGGATVDVKLSDLAARLQTIQGRLASGEVVDPAKVAEIRQAIAEGRFKINPDVIADRLLETVRQLLGEHPKG